MRLLLLFTLLCPALVFAQSYEQEIKAIRQQKAEQMSGNAYAPLKKEQTSFLDYFPADSNYKVKAQVELLLGEQPFQMPTYDGTSNPYQRYAKLHFELKGQQFELTAYQSLALFRNPAYKNLLFLPFMDQTNGQESYGGGRYLDLSTEDIADDEIEIDFNLAYNPYCAYSAGYRCPQPPAENSLNIPIPAGEKNYQGPINERKVNTESYQSISAEEAALINSGSKDSLMHVYQITDEEELAVLQRPSNDVRPDDPLLDKLARRMLLTVQDPNHPGVGIAGPQVGINKNVIWVQRLDKQGEPFEFYINPKITWRSELKRTGPEGCLSIPDLRQDVTRSYAIRLQYTDKNGAIQHEMIEGFTAVIFQHEVDHLYGILFPDRIEESKNIDYQPISEEIPFSMKPGTLRP